jgi:aminoglycoside 6'-N-acetyltransferase I
MQIIDLTAEHDRYVQQAAHLLVIGFREHWPNAWPTMDEALAEMQEALKPDRVCRAAILDDQVVGWIGGLDGGYDGHVWELHPLVVHPDYQGRGIGRALVTDLEDSLRQRGVITLQLGTDDEDDMTSLGGADLYDHLWDKIRHIQNLKNHPYSFYEKMGYTIVGVMPDANGPGKPDIYMAKRL